MILQPVYFDSFSTMLIAFATIFVPTPLPVYPSWVASFAIFIAGYLLASNLSSPSPLVIASANILSFTRVKYPTRVS